MPDIFLLQNQDKLFLSKQSEWVDGQDLTVIFKTEHRDEALNQLFETNAKDYGQRIHIISCEMNEKKLPVIDPDIMPPPLPKKVETETSPEEQAELLEQNDDAKEDELEEKLLIADNGQDVGDQTFNDSNTEHNLESKELDSKELDSKETDIIDESRETDIV